MEKSLYLPVRILLVCVVIGYAWIGSVLLEPRLIAPRSVFTEIRWSERPGFLETEALKRSLLRLESRLGVIGGMKEPVSLTISRAQPFLYKVTESRLELGIDVIAANGQLLKALLKSWLLQRAENGVAGSTVATGSLLRLEVASDVLAAMLTGKMDIVVPGAAKSALAFGPVGNWLKYPQSFVKSCQSSWRSLELSSLDCGRSTALNPLSFRPLLGEMIWQTYQSVPLLNRLYFVKAWADSLVAPVTQTPASQPASLNAWRDWARSEFQELISAEKMAVAGAATLALGRSRLLESLSLEADIMIYHDDSFNAMNLEWRGREVPGKTAIIEGVSGGKALLLPGRVQANGAPFTDTEAALGVWVSCEFPKARDLLDRPLGTKRILVVRACNDGTRVRLKGLARTGIEGFAKENPDTPFIHVQVAALRLAVKRGIVGRNERASSWLRPVVPGSGVHRLSLLGVDQSVWRGDLKAYRVIGAIEAVEWYRLKKM